MNDLKVAFFGTPLFVTPVLKELEDNFDVVAVVSAPPQKIGRKQLLTKSPIQVAFESYIHDPQKSGRKVLTPEAFDQKLIEDLKSLNIDLFVVAAYGKIIPQALLDIPRYGSLNIHPSPLPKYRGPSPIQEAILNGDEVSGVTIIKIDEKMDHGPIIASKEISLQKWDNLETLSNKMFLEGAKLLVEVIPDFINGKIIPKSQDDSKASFCKIIKKEDGFFDIENPPESEILDRKVRAFYPWPTAWTKWKNQVVKFYPNRCIQLEGKRPALFEAFLNGHPDFPLKELI